SRARVLPNRHDCLAAACYLDNREGQATMPNSATARANTAPKPVLVYLVTEDWYFLSHRGPMARAARDAGYAVHVVTQVDRGAAAIRAEGFELHPVTWKRGSINPLAFLANVRAVRAAYRAIDPDLVHHVAVQPSIVGSLAARGLRCLRLNALTGLGFV